MSFNVVYLDHTTGDGENMLQDEHETMAFVVVDIFQVSALRHKYFGMPILSR